MKSFIKLLIVLVFAFSALTATSCSTANLIRWGGDQTSIYSEPTGGFSRGILKPLVTVVGFPVALVPPRLRHGRAKTESSSNRESWW